MTSSSQIRLLACGAALAAVALTAWPATAQVAETQPWQPPVPPVAAKPRDATSDLAAAGPATTAAGRLEARALTSAVFAKPAAAAKAVQKADTAAQPDLATVQPKSEWTPDHSGVGVGGKGVQIKTPF